MLIIVSIRKVKADVIGYNPDSVMATILRLRLVHQGHALKMQEQKEGDNSAIQLASLGAAVANIEKLIKSPNIQSIDRAQNGLNNNSSRFYNSSSMSTMGNNCNGKPKFTGNCFYCGKPGHIARVCFAKQRDSNNRGRFSCDIEIILVLDLGYHLQCMHLHVFHHPREIYKRRK